MFEESLSEAWKKRYGCECPAEADCLTPFLKHRSVRRFADEPIPDAVISGLVAAAQSAATSSNLQAWSVISVENPDLRKEIAEACGHQKQVLTAPLFFAFIADLNRIHRYAEMAGLEPDGLDTAEMYTVALVDAALAAERMVCAAESLGYGICYVGGLRNHPEQVKQLLHLPERTFGIFGLCIGRPAENARADIKPRLGQDQVWFRDAYPSELSSEDYDARMHEFFESQGMASDEPWSKKSGRRTQITGLSGREALLEFLREQGLLRR
jgi:nitroreductase